VVLPEPFSPVTKPMALPGNTAFTLRNTVDASGDPGL
jgi:hypothetical protein